MTSSVLIEEHVPEVTMSRLHELDGFQVVSAVASLLAGPIMLLMGAPAGWAFLIMTAGALVLFAQWVILARVVFKKPDALTIVLGVVGVALLAVAVVYLTRSANDLPTSFPGYDADSENFRLIPGALAQMVGAVCAARAAASLQPTRRSSSSRIE